MAAYQVSREIKTVETGKASSTSVARRNAADSVRDTVDAADDAGSLTIDTDAVDVYEFPAGPFEPYRVTVSATLVAAVEAVDEPAALAAGADAIETTLSRAELDEWEYVTDATLLGA